MVKRSSANYTRWPKTARSPLPVFLRLAVLMLVAGVLAPPSAHAQRVKRYTFFEGAQYPLTAWFIEGDEPGPTLMVQGGIQGDEKAGFITAQLLTKARVRKGQLIVVPRANVPSINICQRQVNVDLNRRFDKEYNQFYEDRLALAIRFLVSQAEAFIHLHEGSGFYHPTYVDNLRNPRRYGQSIIIDTTIFDHRIHLAETASRVLAELNPTVLPAQYRFQLFNTRTFENNTPYPEMRKSLTCYALENVGIPAMAVEVSKNIRQLGWKVQRQLAATALLLARFGVDISPPEVTEQEVDHYTRRIPRIECNGRVLSDKQTLTLAPNSILALQASASDNSFAPSLSVCASDRPDFNLLTTPRMALAPFQALEVRVDGSPAAKIKIRWKGAWSKPPGNEAMFACWLNGQLRLVPAGQTLDTVAGDQLVLEGVLGGTPHEVLNFKGYVAKPYSNDGQDVGMEIILDPNNFIKRYLKRGKSADEWICRVVRETKGAQSAEFHIRVSPRTVKALQLEGPKGRDLLLPFTNGGFQKLASGTWRITDAWSNGSAAKLSLTLNNEPIRFGEAFTLSEGDWVKLKLHQSTTFHPLGEIDLICPSVQSNAKPPRPSLSPANAS